MIRKAILKIKTALALKKGSPNRVSEAYKQASAIGLLYSYEKAEDEKPRRELIEKLEADGKKVSTMTFVGISQDIVDPEYAFFTEKDFNAKGSWSKPIVEGFIKQPFDFLISMDCQLNKYTQHILASSSSKCRVGKFEEGKSKYFELMINSGEMNYSAFLKSLYHYLTNVRNG